MALQTRKPTGKPSWPVLLIAGAEKSGKSWACAEASASSKIARTLWVSVGETDPDQYGAIPGASFEIVEHDGRVSSVISVLSEIASLPHDPAKPTLLVVDSMTRLWEQCSAWAQGVANQRAKNGAEGVITMDLWNRAKAYHAHAVQAILAHQGPVLLTARLEPVTVMDDRGRPTPIKADKIKTEKGLPYDVDGVIEMPERGKAFISGVRSTVLQLPERREYPGFTVDGLWDALGLDDTAERRVTAAGKEDDGE
ncbi:AAA family ATPase [Pseudoclavibacter alba]|uniref:ATP-binding protein n=1 Tax=Pseudoclavibacter albus TaxID=272241 RepID=A0ABT2HWE8_9MICO|nr:AAA family ATPase [Pseudoclavibacter alba]MBN6777403.1 AAA family ATPase [Pseudoclavibacter alba]MCT2042640.1 ATP-binding protein [Pseudoclavibacter alba]